MGFSAYLTGLGLGLSLIAAIGAQNAFVLRQGLLRQHVLAVVLTCAISDAVLIAAGVGGLDALLARWPWIEPVLRWGGVAFLFVYGLRAFRSAWVGGGAMQAASGAGQSLGAVLATCLAFTWLNPHVYLDTVVLIGSISSGWAGLKWVFGAGAISASFLFFFSLGYGARLLAPVFAKPVAWRVLDALVGCIMWLIALRLALHA